MVTKRQREILEYVKSFVDKNGYAPSLEEIGERFSLRSVATVHKHIANLADRGMLRRGTGSRSIEVLEQPERGGVSEVPLLGRIAAGRPIEAVAANETFGVPASMMKSRRRLFVLEVTGESMRDEGIFDGDHVVCEHREEALNGDTVVALVGGESATLKKYFRDGPRIRLQPANPAFKPMIYPDESVRIQGVVVGLVRHY